MDGRKKRANYMKQGGLKMYAPWVIWLIGFVQMIYLYAQIGQKGITFYAAALFTILFIYVLTAAVIPDVLGRMVYSSEEQGLQQKRTQTVSHSYDPDTACSAAFLRSGIFAG